MVSRKKQLVIAVNVILLFAVTGLAIYALYMIDAHSIPIPTVLAAITIVLPAFTGVSVETVRATNRYRQKRQGRQFISTYVPVFFLTIVETVLVTLAGTHVGPKDGLSCGLEGRWQSLFSNKNASRIKRIQDAFQCCGLMSVKDKAWPFPDRQHQAGACHVAFGRDKSCFEDWRKDEQSVAIVLMLVPILVFVWQMIVLTAPPNQHSWLGRINPRAMIANGPQNSQDAQNPGRVLEYSSVQDQYRDNPDEDGDPLNPEEHADLERMRSEVNEEATRVHSRRQSRRLSRRDSDQNAGREVVEQNVWGVD